MRTFRPVTLALVAALVCIVGAGCRKSSTSPVAPSTPSNPTGMGLSVQGIAIEGPLPPDTAFLPWKRKATDAFVCMYHDQGHIPVKALAFDSAVNSTLGLPIVRTSVDHGTACDIAWQGKANPSSIFAAVRLALRLAG